MKNLNLFFIIIILILSSCSLQDENTYQSLWSYTDLVSLDPVDASEPAYDLIALYSQGKANQERIRIDLLEHSSNPNYDLYLALDTHIGGTNNLPINGQSDIEWDRLIVIPAIGRINILDKDGQKIGQAAIRIIRDITQDTLEISLNQKALFPANFQPAKTVRYNIQVFLTPQGSTHISDQIGPIRNDSKSPAPAKVIFAFWNSFPAYTPATALRRWSGAHTGPLGGSHGLSHLISTSQAAGIPVVLLDLKAPPALSALDQMGKLNTIKELEKNGGVILPETIPETLNASTNNNSPFIQSLSQYQRDIAQQFGIPPSIFSFSQSGFTPTENFSQLVFQKHTKPVKQLTPVVPLRWQNKVVIPISEPDNQTGNEQATEQGVSLDVKRALIETALSDSQRTGKTQSILILGGSLPDSTWGVPNLARSGFLYINNHPWIKPLSIHDLKSLSGLLPATNIELNEVQSKNTLIDSYIQNLEQALLEAPSNVISRAAWQAYISLISPVYPSSPNLSNLRSNYISNVWSLLEASHWAEVPYELSSCNIDPDRDGQKECLIANQETFTLLEIENGAISFAFMRLHRSTNSDDLYQLIAPSSQFITGLSDPLFWELDSGNFSDPSVIPGAFADLGSSYQASLITQNQVIFSDQQTGIQKTISIAKNHIDIHYQGIDTNVINMVQVPIALNPWNRFESEWGNAYRELSLKDGWGWQVDSSRIVKVYASNEISAFHFNQSRNDLQRAENPNKDYQKGHFLPYPLALLEIPTSNELDIHIELKRTDIIE